MTVEPLEVDWATVKKAIVARKWFIEHWHLYPHVIALSTEMSREYHPQWYKKITPTTYFATCGLIDMGRLWMFKSMEARASFESRLPQAGRKHILGHWYIT